MRGAFVKALVELAGRDERIVLLTGDLGYGVVDGFRDAHPDRFFNVGVAEQNLVGVGTGLAEAGFIPFLYSISTFITLRAYEFIRNGPILHSLPVRIVAVGGGVEYGHAGITHYGLEDVGAMRLQPGITVIAPSDGRQAQAALRATWDLPGPVYYRIGKNEDAIVHGHDGSFTLGKTVVIGSGTDVVLVAMGNIVTEAMTARTKLEERGVDCSVAVVSTLNPAPMDDLAETLSGFRLAITLEAHYICGGLGSMVSEIVAQRGLDCRVVPMGFDSMPGGETSGQDDHYRRRGLTGDQVAQTALALLEKTPS